MSIHVDRELANDSGGAANEVDAGSSAPVQGASNSDMARRAAEARASRNGNVQLQQGSVESADLSSADVQATAQAGVSQGGAQLPYLDQVQKSFGGHNISGVRAHTDANAQAASEALNAKAYATGNDVAFADTPTLHTVAHEAAHIVQQREGVSLKSGVGQSGDEYERHADAVADVVVAGGSAEAMLGEPGRGTGTPAVQRLQATPTKSVATRANTNGAKLEAIETLEDTRPNKGKAEFAKKYSGVAVKNGKSMAKDPQFEKWAQEFEMSFGAGAMSNGTAQGTAKALCDRIIDIIITAHNTSKQEDEAALSRVSPALRGVVGKACGLDDSGKFAGVAGAVSRDKVLDHMGGDNIRTQMTAVYNFGRPFQALLQKMIKGGSATRFLESLGGDTAQLESRMEDLESNPRARLTPTQTEGAVGGQAATRGEFANSDAHQSIRKGSSVGLTKDEADFQGIDKDDGRLKWAEGARKWRMNENNEWVQAMRELSMPLKAGPSGTTDRLMQTQAILGVSTPVNMRAACLAYLLPINAHSMVEIMVAAKQHGADFAPGWAMYKSVEPFGSLAAYSPHEDFWSKVNS